MTKLAQWYNDIENAKFKSKLIPVTPVIEIVFVMSFVKTLLNEPLGDVVIV